MRKLNYIIKTMKLSRIKIKNVKSFNDEENISLNNDSNILIGSNGSGKSNLLGAKIGYMSKLF